MRNGLSLKLLLSASVLALGLGACAPEEPTATGVIVKRSSASPPPNGSTSAAGGIDPSEPSASEQNSLLPSPGAASPTPTPTPLATASPLVAVKSVTVGPATFLTLYPPASEASKSLGFASAQQMTVSVTLEDGSTGAYEWVDLSEGHLSVSKTNLLSVNAGTPPGLYDIEARAVDDPNQSMTVTVWVKSTTILDVTIN